ncbi:MAG: acetoacetate--CoA ligase [Bacteroidetes bacterium]|nr:acetoacetate--CoA ligase [Bacteroidota bacterium]
MHELLWTPKEKYIQSTNIYHFTKLLSANTGITFNDYNDLHNWSVNDLENLWEIFLKYSGIIYSGEYKKVLSSYKMPGVKWFEGIKLNYAENIFEKNYNGTAVKFLTEGYEHNFNSEYQYEYSFEELKNETFKCAGALINSGIKKGDIVAGYISNVPEAIIACLACASIGAVWSSASPDFGLEALVDRFSQINPKIVFASSNYLYNGKIRSSKKVIIELKKKVPSINKIVVVPFHSGDLYKSDTDIVWEEFLSKNVVEKNNYEMRDFNDPLFIMFSSGTTGVPKCILHSLGGTLLQHKKEHLLHCDIKQGDRLLYFTTTGWMMWNWQLSALASGAAIYLYEGSPAYPNLQSIWEKVDANNITHFGTSGRYIETCMKSEIKDHSFGGLEFNNLRSVFYTGSPLSAEGYKWIYSEIKKDLHFAGISGGTDIISCFVLGNPALPVYAGKIQCKGLGIDAAAFDEDGNEIINKPGELICRKPVPSMPIGFLNDSNGKKYLDSYFAGYPGVWTHGDYIEFDKNGNSVIYGRSDATLNPGGVRIGCAEIYSALDELLYIKGAAAVGWNPPGQLDEIIILFVVLNDNLILEDKFSEEIKKVIQKKRSSRHVPKFIFQISSLPVTRSGKPVELGIKAVLSGKEVKNRTALDNPEVLNEIELFGNQLLKYYSEF